MRLMPICKPGNETHLQSRPLSDARRGIINVAEVIEEHYIFRFVCHLKVESISQN